MSGPVIIGGRPAVAAAATVLATVLVQIGSTSMRVPDAPYNLQAWSTAFQIAGAVRP
jgi:hypothetical protein